MTKNNFKETWEWIVEVSYMEDGEEEYDEFRVHGFDIFVAIEKAVGCTEREHKSCSNINVTKVSRDSYLDA